MIASPSPSRTSSVGSRADSQSPVGHAPKASIQALLDELSDSDDELVSKTTRKAATTARVTSPTAEAEGSSEDEDEVVLGRGRLAARLDGDVSSAQPMLPTFTAEETDDVDSAPSNPQRRFLLKRKRPTADDEASPARSTRSKRSADGSPTPSPKERQATRSVTASPIAQTAQDSETASKNRFAELVEKKRAERLAREEAERAKKAARVQQQTEERRTQRGSSVADDSVEDSDMDAVTAARKLTKDARPTRKASKKALEEMSRETQRMNRSMQLQHQAKTKKKFTLDGFFNKFNRVEPQPQPEPETAPSSSSPARSSDSEKVQEVHTPITSPMLGPSDSRDKEQNVSEAPISDEFDEDMDLLEMMKARTEEAYSRIALPTPVPETAAEEMVMKATVELDSDGELEVVYDTAEQRKYVAFERVPKRKAHQVASHLTLRGLAQVKREKDKKSKMSATAMAQSLRDAARKQATDERKAKIELLKARGITFQTAEERDAAEEEVEDILEKARVEEEEIRKREKQLAKKNGTYVKELDDEDSDDEDSDFAADDEAASGSEDENEEDDADGDDENEADDDDELIAADNLLDDAAQDSDVDESLEDEAPKMQVMSTALEPAPKTPLPSRTQRNARRILDEDDEEDLSATLKTVQVPQSPALPSAGKTPQSVFRSTRKVIPGLQHSDDLPIGLTQAFAATMADSQDCSATQEQDSMEILDDMPSPNISIQPRLARMESLDVISESVLGSQTQPLDLDFGLAFSGNQHAPQSPALQSQFGGSQSFELTQDVGYSFSPFKGNRFAETPNKAPHSTEDTILLEDREESPMMRRSKLRRGQRVDEEEQEVEDDAPASETAFNVMAKAAKRNKRAEEYQKKKSQARQAFDEAAEESDDEYAGLGGASDDESGEEDESDRQMIDEDTQVGIGDEAALAKLHADREREEDEQRVQKLYKDVTTGALRRKRGVGDDLDDLSDEDEATARRRKAKQREFAKMRRELLKDEAVGKIADDKQKAAFLKTIEDRDDDDDDSVDYDEPESQPQEESQTQPALPAMPLGSQPAALRPVNDSKLNISSRRGMYTSRKPGTLAEIRESVSFLIDEPDSQAATIDMDLSDSEDDEAAYVDLDRHITQAEADENEDEENEGLADFIVDDEPTFKKPAQPIAQDRAPFNERRTKPAVVDRLSLMRQSSSASSNASSRQAFGARSSSFGVPSLLRRATTNSTLRGGVSSTGVVTRAERGTGQEKEFIRKGSNNSRNAINYQGRQNLKEEKMSARAGVVKKQQQSKKKAGGGFLQGLFGRGDSWA